MLAKPDVSEFLNNSGAPCARLVAEVIETPESQAIVADWKEKTRAAGIELEGDAFERGLLRQAAADFEPRIGSLPIPESVKKLLGEEFSLYTKSARGASIEVGSYPFVTACKTISLRRFPAGPMDWDRRAV